MELTAAEAHYLQETAARWVRERRPAFARLPPALQRLVIRLQVRTLGCEPDFQAIEALRAAETPLVLRPELSLARDPTGVIRRVPRARTTFSPAAKVFAITGAQGKISFADIRIDWQIRSNGSRASSVPKSKSGACEYFDADAVGRSITLRHWQPGDRFQAIGAEHAVKLQDLFVNAKIPRVRRRELALAVDEA